MNAKELQAEYFENLQSKPKKIILKEKYQITDSYLKHVRNQARIIKEMVGLKNGIQYLQEALIYDKEISAKEIEKLKA